MSLYNKIGKLQTMFNKLGSDDATRTEMFCDKISQMMGGDKPQLTPEDFSFTELFNAVPVSAFPVIVGELISKKVMSGYQLAETVGDQLVETMTSKLQVDKITGTTRKSRIKAMVSGENYDHSGEIGEKWAQIEGKKYGEILDITEETILFDLTGQVLREAGNIGQSAALYREELIIGTVIDATGYKGYYPSGLQTDLYSVAAQTRHLYGNLITNILADETDIQGALSAFALMRNEDGKPITIIPKTLLIPQALEFTAIALLGSAIKVGNIGNNEPNPVYGRYNIVKSPYMDTMGDATDWYLGDFKKQFIWKEIYPIQVLSRKDTTNSDAWERDIISQHKVRFFGTCGATDYVYVVKSNGTA